jgi:hypothetical protein
VRTVPDLLLGDLDHLEACRPQGGRPDLVADLVGEGAVEGLALDLDDEGQWASRKSTRPTQRSSSPESTWRRISGSPAWATMAAKRRSRLLAGGT